MALKEDMERLYTNGRTTWELARKNFEALQHVETKIVKVDGEEICVQHNPARAVSSLAKLDKKTIESRPCFLCKANRPKEQEWVEWRDYELLLNPYPIFDRHFTVAAKRHEPQQLTDKVVADMVALAKEAEGYVVLFNGAKAGASAPDHLHLQMVSEAALHTAIGTHSALRGNRQELPRLPQETGLVNVLMTWREGQLVCDTYYRKAHRPKEYFSGERMLSPGAIDMAGTLIAARREDYEQISAADIASIYAQVRG